MREIDVIVLGAGISGCVAGALLAKRGYRTLILSRDGGTAHHLPESWIYRSLPSIVELGLEEKILPALKKESQAVFCSADHQKSIEFLVRDTEEIREGDVVWVDRNRFDRILLDAALEQGAIFHPLSRVTDCQISEDAVTLQVEDREFRAFCLFDATGKSSFLSNHLKLSVVERKLDARAAYFSHFELDDGIPSAMRIVAIQGGYLFCIPVSEHRLSIGCVIGEQWIQSASSPDEIFAAATASSSYVSDLIGKSKRVLPVIPAKNYQRICLKPAGSRYRLIGDAAAFLDPFFCPGIEFAFFSAQEAVDTLEPDAPQAYEEAVAKWLEGSTSSIYEKIEKSEWNGILRLFADPHLPWVVPLMLTQSFCRKSPIFEEGIQSARRAYEVASR